MLYVCTFFFCSLWCKSCKFVFCIIPRVTLGIARRTVAGASICEKIQKSPLNPHASRGLPSNSSDCHLRGVNPFMVNSLIKVWFWISDDNFWSFFSICQWPGQGARACRIGGMAGLLLQPAGQDSRTPGDRRPPHWHDDICAPVHGTRLLTVRAAADAAHASDAQPCQRAARCLLRWAVQLRRRHHLI